MEYTTQEMTKMAQEKYMANEAMKANAPAARASEYARELPAEIDAIDRTADWLSELVGRLEEKLEPVLSSPNPETNATSEPDLPLSLHATRIRNVRRGVSNSCFRLQELIERLEV